MRLDSPFVLAFAGTLALHTILIVAADAVVLSNPRQPDEPAPVVELIEIEVPKPKAAPPPPKEEEIEQPVVKEDPPPTKVVQQQQQRRQVQQPPRTETPPTTESDAGGTPSIKMDDLGVGTSGFAPAGPIQNRDGGGNGKGGGKGKSEGDGAKTEAPIPTPASISGIKTDAQPKGDYSYFGAGKDYPPAARQLGIEGVIKVQLLVDDKGKVRSAELQNRLGHGLDELVLSYSWQIQFTPAKDTNDRPVASTVVWTFTMTLPK